MRGFKPNIYLTVRMVFATPISANLFQSSQWQKLKRFEQRRMQKLSDRHVGRRVKITESLKQAESYVKDRCQQDVRGAFESMQSRAQSQADDLSELLKVLDSDDLDADMFI